MRIETYSERRSLVWTLIIRHQRTILRYFQTKGLPVCDYRIRNRERSRTGFWQFLCGHTDGARFNRLNTTLVGATGANAILLKKFVD
jgi:hypothetical protein